MEQENNNSSLFQLNLDASNSYTLRSAASWAKVVGVVGMILGILLILMAVMAFSRASNSYGGGDEGFVDVFANSRSSARTGGTMLIIIGAIFIIGAVFSYQFGNQINMALRANDQDGLDKGFAALRNYYALRGIVLIIVLLLFLISFASML